jgi:hypothetical protein
MIVGSKIAYCETIIECVPSFQNGEAYYQTENLADQDQMSSVTIPRGRDQDVCKQRDFYSPPLRGRWLRTGR